MAIYIDNIDNKDPSVFSKELRKSGNVGLVRKGFIIKSKKAGIR